MDDVKKALERMQQRMNEFGGQLQDLSGELKAYGQQTMVLTQNLNTVTHNLNTVAQNLTMVTHLMAISADHLGTVTDTARRVDEKATKLAETFDLFKVSANDEFAGLIAADIDMLDWRERMEIRVSDIERRLAG